MGDAARFSVISGEISHFTAKIPSDKEFFQFLAAFADINRTHDAAAENFFCNFADGFFINIFKLCKKHIFRNESFAHDGRFADFRSAEAVSIEQIGKKAAEEPRTQRPEESGRGREDALHRLIKAARAVFPLSASMS